MLTKNYKFYATLYGLTINNCTFSAFLLFLGRAFEFIHALESVIFIQRFFQKWNTREVKQHGKWNGA